MVTPKRGRTICASTYGRRAAPLNEPLTLGIGFQQPTTRRLLNARLVQDRTAQIFASLLKRVQDLVRIVPMSNELLAEDDDPLIGILLL